METGEQKLTSHKPVPVLAIDGPSGSGKGTVGLQIAKMLQWHFLDSGALYRALVFAAPLHGVSVTDEEELATLALHLDLVFEILPTEGCRILVDGQSVEASIRSETCGNAASKIAALPRVRQALLKRQRTFQRPPGLVADGRDMGTVVFPHALLKIFLDASPEERAKRRFHQLKGNLDNVSLSRLAEEIASRDKRDRERQVAPLRPAEDALVIDTTDLSIEAVLNKVMEELKQRLRKGGA